RRGPGGARLLRASRQIIKVLASSPLEMEFSLLKRALKERLGSPAPFGVGPQEGKGAQDVCALCLWPSSSSASGSHRLSSIARKNLAAGSEQKHLCRIHDIRRATERLGQGRSVGAL